MNQILSIIFYAFFILNVLPNASAVEIDGVKVGVGQTAVSDEHEESRNSNSQDNVQESKEDNLVIGSQIHKKESSYYLSINPGIYLVSGMNNLTEAYKPTLLYGGQIRINLEKNNKGFGIDSSFGLTSILGVQRRVFTLGLLYNVYSPRIGAFYTYGFETISFLNFRTTAGLGLRFGIVKDLSPSFQYLAETKLNFYRGTKVGVDYSSMGYQLMLGLSYHLGIGEEPIRNQLTKTENSAKRPPKF